MNNLIVDVHGVKKYFGSFGAVKGISLAIQRGEIFGLLGANGSGKSTTIRILCGILEPTEGTGQVVGYDLRRESELIKSSIGYMSQKFSLYEDLTPLENVRLFLGIYNVPTHLWSDKIEWLVDNFKLKNFLERRTGDLPTGWKQRLALGCAILHNPPLLFLDEPTSGVDPLSRRQFWGFIRQMAKGGVTVMVTTHYMDEAGYCHRLALLNEGLIIAMGPPEEIVKKACGEDETASLEKAFVKLIGKRADS
ncbi:MAG: ABC transporter ATP-binding protein [Syntrophales bacterium]|nr:ABC transporter ATP-binding protein [Syntrophales bacterium]